MNRTPNEVAALWGVSPQTVYRMIKSGELGAIDTGWGFKTVYRVRELDLKKHQLQYGSRPARRDHFVYRAYDEVGRLLYVGCTKRLESRRATHRENSDWFPFAARCFMTGPLTRPAALDLERSEIQSLDPHFNRKMHSRMGSPKSQILADYLLKREQVAA